MSSFDEKGLPSAGESAPETGADIWTPIRRELLNWLRREAPSLAGAYEGAVRLLHIPDFPGKVHFVSHVVRDIYNTLPRALDGSIKRVAPGEAYRSLVTKVERHWPKEHVSFDAESSSPDLSTKDSETIPITRIAFTQVNNLLVKWKEIESQPTTGEYLSRVLLRLNPATEVAIPRRIIATFDSERKWFTKRAHLVATASKIPSDDGLVQHFEAFEAAFFSFVGHYFSGTRELDDILLETNRSSD